MAVVKEKYGPAILATIFAVVFIFYGSTVFAYAKSQKWNIPAIYSSIFDLSSIITAFIFSFFTFARTSETDFLHQMRKTRTYKAFMGYLITAMYSSGFLVFASIPFMIAEPQPTATSDIWFVLCTAWVWLVTFSLAATTRSVRQFIVLAMVEKE